MNSNVSGESVENPGSSIVGGTNADPNEFPWQVSLQNIFDGTHECAGSLIHERWVLTAAHCMIRGGRVIPANSGVIVLGEHDFGTESGNEQTIGVDKIFVHPDYNPATNENDIALLLLNTPATINSFVSTIDTATSANVGSAAEPGVTATITGWGNTAQDIDADPNDNSSVVPDILQKAQATILSEAAADAAYSGRRDIKETMLAAARSGIDTCDGDSGGPLTVENGPNTLLAGITSFGFGCADPAFPGIYTRVSSFETWIKNTMNSVLVVGTGGDFATIQLAVNAANAGDVIQILPGSYMEQVTINKDLTLFGSGSSMTTIISPASGLAALSGASMNRSYIIGVTNGATVTIESITVDGGSTGTDNLELVGIAGFDSNVSVNECVIQNVDGGSGIGIAEFGSGYLYVDRVTVNTFYEAGISYKGDGTNWAAVVFSAVTGNLSASIRQFGIHLEGATNATFGGNTVNQISGGTPTNVSVAISSINNDDVLIDKNTITGTDSLDGYGIYVNGNRNSLNVTGNSITDIGFGVVFDGLPAGTFSGTIGGNDITDGPVDGAAIFIDTVTATITNNSLRDNDTGIYLLDDSNVIGNSIISNNEISGVGAAGSDAFFIVSETTNAALDDGSAPNVDNGVTFFGSTQTVNAANNWFGNTVAADINAQIRGDVTVSPFLLSGDVDNNNVGFLPPVVDNEAPFVNAIISSTPNGTYADGDDINITVRFSEIVFLNEGTLDVMLSTGVTLNMSAVIGDSVFGTYNVGPTESDSDLDVTNVSLSGGTLQDSGNNDAILTLPMDRNLADIKELVIDNTPIVAVPNRIGYQGHVQVNGKNFNGDGLFKFMLFADPNLSSSVLWTNDDSSSDIGTPPTNAVDISVVNGLYSVNLGDENIMNMTPITPDVFHSPNAYLQVWFNDNDSNGVNQFQLLSPDQTLNTSAYAFIAAEVAPGSIANESLESGSFANITGVGELDHVTVTGSSYLAALTGRVGIGIDNPSEKLSVDGKIESTNGGFKFPDGSELHSAANVSAIVPVGSGSDIIASGLISYFAANGSDIESIENYVQFPLPRDGMVRSFTIKITSNSLDGHATLTLRINGADTGIWITVPAGATGVYSNGNTAEAMAGDLFSIEVDTTAAGSGELQYVSGSFEY